MMHCQLISDNEIYLLIKYIKSVLCTAAKRLSYTEDARCLKVNILAAEVGVLTARTTKVAYKPTSGRFKPAHMTVIYFPKKYFNIILAFTSSPSKCL